MQLAGQYGAHMHHELFSAQRQLELRVKRRKRHPNRPLTAAQIRTLLASIDTMRDDALIRLGLSVGPRAA
jgi:integrase